MGGKTAAMRAAASEPGPKWFVVVCHSGREREAKARLIEQGFEAYLPMKLGHPKSKRPISPFFPRYLFVRFDPTISQWLCICSTIGVHDIIRSAAGWPLAVPGRMIDQIRGWEVEGVIHLMAANSRSKPVFQKGDKVKVVDGHFAGMSGLVHIVHDSDRVTVMLALVARGESLKVELKSGALEGSRSPAGV